MNTIAQPHLIPTEDRIVNSNFSSVLSDFESTSTPHGLTTTVDIVLNGTHPLLGLDL